MSMTPTSPFIPRPKDQPAWWFRPATAEEYEAVERQRREREVLSGVRRDERADR